MSETNNDKLYRDVQIAEALCNSRGTPEVAEILEYVLTDIKMNPAPVDTAVKALTDPVAFALNKSREEGREAGMQAARDAISRKLGLL